MIDPRFPNLFVIGAPKCATTSLHSALASVPDTYMTAVKEPGFFSTDEHFDRGVPHYLRSFFSNAGSFPLRGESTPWYLYSADARNRIAQARQDMPVKIVVLIRQPSDRAYSMFLDQQRAGLERRSFEQAVSAELASERAGTATGPPQRRYVWSSEYARHIQEWSATFSSDSVRTFLAEDLRSPERFWPELSRFLDVDLGPERLSDLPRSQTNAASGRRWPWVDRAMRSTDGEAAGIAIRAARKVIPTRLYREVAQSISGWNQADGPPPEPKPMNILSMLDETFREEIENLQDLLQRDLSGWLPGHVRRSG